MAATPEFTSVRATPAWRLKLAAFWRWWTGEISQLVPERFSLGAGRTPLLAPEGDDVVMLEPRGAAGAEATVALAGLDEPRRRAEVRALLERAGETRGRARVALGRDEALVRRVTMPAATEENLGQVLGYEMDRLTPFKAEDVYFDYRVISRDAATGQILVQIAVARRDVVDARVEKLRALGVNVQGVGVRDDTGHPGAPLDLLPSEQRGERESSRERTLHWILVGAVLALFLTVLLLPVWQKRETVLQLHPMLGKAKQEADATDTIARELDRQVADYNYLVGRKHATPPVLAYIEEMSRLLPDTTWVQQFDVKTVGKTREIQVTGETSSASKLIELLEQSALLQNAAPRGTVTRGSQPGSERFMIAAEARPRPQPEARPVMEMISAIPTPVSTALPGAPPLAVQAPATATLTPVPSSSQAAAPTNPESAPVAGAEPATPKTAPAPPPKSAETSAAQAPDAGTRRPLQSGPLKPRQPPALPRPPPPRPATPPPPSPPSDKPAGFPPYGR